MTNYYVHNIDPEMFWKICFLYDFGCAQTGRSQFVKLGNHRSTASPITPGVPQCSVLGPLLFTIYTSPIAAIASAHSISQQQYADDTQLYIALSLNDSLQERSTAVVGIMWWLLQNFIYIYFLEENKFCKQSQNCFYNDNLCFLLVIFRASLDL